MRLRARPVDGPGADRFPARWDTSQRHLVGLGPRPGLIPLASAIAASRSASRSRSGPLAPATPIRDRTGCLCRPLGACRGDLGLLEPIVRRDAVELADGAGRRCADDRAGSWRAGQRSSARALQVLVSPASESGLAACSAPRTVAAPAPVEWPVRPRPARRITSEVCDRPEHGERPAGKVTRAGATCAGRSAVAADCDPSRSRPECECADLPTHVRAVRHGMDIAGALRPPRRTSRPGRGVTRRCSLRDERMLGWAPRP